MDVMQAKSKPDFCRWMPASVFVLTAAFETLRDEEDAAMSASQNALQKAATWAKTKLGF